MKPTPLSRRTFLETGLAGIIAAGVAPQCVTSRVWGANAPSRKVTLGFIGVGTHGFGVNLMSFLQQDDCEVLAVCDVFASPHVPNPDGSPFFGSPTKLSEYMAMGRGIVASALDQIAEVLEDGRTAILVPPADAQALARALETLVVDRDLRLRLGAAARRVVLERHTWHAHVGRTLAALRAVG